ncbi:hypothetical protein HanPSC8_Chr15g0655941 [Helianthus annuus]|nr:hypothetical protein HanPSC8_Chr15g0655941 [Helianthus annuus]
MCFVKIGFISVNKKKSFVVIWIFSIYLILKTLVFYNFEIFLTTVLIKFSVTNLLNTDTTAVSAHGSCSGLDRGS